MDREFIAERQRGLQAYLDLITQHPLLSSSLSIKKFLDPNNYSANYTGVFTCLFWFDVQFVSGQFQHLKHGCCEWTRGVLSYVCGGFSSLDPRALEQQLWTGYIGVSMQTLFLIVWT